MRRLSILLLFFSSLSLHTQQSDFRSFDFHKIDKIAKNFKAKQLDDLNNITYNLTKDFDTDIEKFRAIFVWITHNVSNDYKLYAKNSRKRKRFEEDTIKLAEWNSKFKKIIFKKLIRKKRTICTGYAYLLKEMSDIVGIKAEIVHGYGRTADVNVENLEDPNHSWNVVKLNDKWYLCDPTWAAGISYPDQGKFVFGYNDGLFLTAPDLFLFNHYPMYSQYTLTPVVPSLTEFVNLPLLYSGTYNTINAHIAPKKMHHKIVQNDYLKFEYELKEGILIPNDKIKLITVSRVAERTYRPEVIQNGNRIQLKHQFKKRGFYDIHIYMGETLIASYTADVKKEKE